LLDLLEGTVDDALRDRLLAALHDHVHELGELDIAVLGIRQDFTLGDFATTWHFNSPFNLLQPDLEGPREPIGIPLTRPGLGSLRSISLPGPNEHRQTTKL